MGTFINIAQFIASLGLLILLHEFGHFITARMFKIRVDKFYLFFDFLFPLPGVLNFSLFKKKIGDTEYGIGWFPMGGYVQIAGMIDENLDTEQMKKPAEPWEFRAHPAWQRLIVMLGGIIVNVLLAFIIYAMILFTWGEKKIPMSSLKDGIECSDSLGMAVGFRTGDKIISVDGNPVKYLDDLRIEILLGQTVQIDRNGKKVELTLPKNFIDQIATSEKFGFGNPRTPPIFAEFVKGSINKDAGLKEFDRVVGINDTIPVKFHDELKQHLQSLAGNTITLNVERNATNISVPVKVSAEGKIEAAFAGRPDDLIKLGIISVETKTYGFFESFPAGVRKTGQELDKYVRQFKMIFTPSTGGYKHIGGFKSMSKMFGEEWIWEDFWNRTAFLSIVLAFMNLLPIPALDGGHVVFTLYEMITRRAPSVKVLTYAQYVGMAILLFLMLYANLNDFVHFFK
ncbi:MAG: Peptidase family [Bacteroidota bacterium]|jgi:regulator of sigma E protease|nr:Peptidase family [Bacteroidota bacterium]